MSTDDTLAFLRELRALGVTRYTCAEFTVELSHVAPVDEQPAVDPMELRRRVMYGGGLR